MNLQIKITEAPGACLVSFFVYKMFHMKHLLRVTEGEARNMLAGFMFYQEMVFRKVANLSGGERMRLRLARFIHQSVNTLILDEPTNQLDIVSREVLEEALRNFKGTIIAVSHDRYFIDQICSKVIHLHEGRLNVY